MVRSTGAQRRTPRDVAVALAIALAPTAGGCGGDEFANEPRPAAPIIVSAVITPREVSVSPSGVGAGMIELLASNQTATSQRLRLRLRSRRIAPGEKPLAQTTGPINPGDTASLKAEVGKGIYVVATSSPAIDAARLAVGPARGSAKDRLLQP
jgi:hypothetical protein